MKLLLVAALLLTTPWIAPAAERPNVILIVVDDPGYADFSDAAHRPADVKTPHLDALAAESTCFTQAYVTAPICNASRLALLTGRYQQRFGTRWYKGPGISKDDSPTLGEVFRESGYRTAMIGKVHHGSEDRVDNRNHPIRHGYDSLFGFLDSTKHYLKHSREFAGMGGGPLSMGPMLRGQTWEDIEGYSTALFGDEARRFVKENRERSFFLHLSFNAVHNYTYQLPPEYLAEKGIPPIPDYDPKQGSLNEWRKKLNFPANPNGRSYYLGQLHFLDVEVGRLMQTLRESGVNDRTVVVLIGDNGGSLVTYADNAPLRGGKYTLFEGGIRVPLWMRAPKFFKAGAGALRARPASHHSSSRRSEAAGESGRRGPAGSRTGKGPDALLGHGL